MSSEEYQFITVKCVGKLSIITFNDPKKFNYFNQSRYKEVTKALNDAAANDSISAIAITGAGKLFHPEMIYKNLSTKKAFKAKYQQLFCGNFSMHF